MINAEQLESKIIEEIRILGRIMESAEIYNPKYFMKEINIDSPLHQKFFGENLAEYQKKLIIMADINSRIKCLDELYKQHFPNKPYLKIKEEIREEVNNLITLIDNDVKAIGKIFSILFSINYEKREKL